MLNQHSAVLNETVALDHGGDGKIAEQHRFTYLYKVVYTVYWEA
jgi:hypothetical protein